ncbi:MAG: hypothetical protein ABIP55_01375 [Tepidisphaeraceae bacterium]
MKTNKLLAAIVVLQGVILIGQWTGGGAAVLPQALAQVPDPANRQMQMIEQLSLLNGKVDQIVTILQSGDVQVKVAKTEETKGSTPAPKK